MSESEGVMPGSSSEQRLGVTPSARVRRIGSEHAAELLDDLAALELRYGGSGELLGACLLDPEVPLGERGDLRQVRDAEHLTAAPERAQLLADRARGVTADAGVALVEEERAGAAARGNAHQRKHDSRQLTARGAVAQRCRR